MIGAPLCTITFFEGNEVFVVATNDASIEKIWPLTAALKLNIERKDNLLNLSPHPADKFEVKFYKCLPILDVNGLILGSLNIIDDKERDLTEFENNFLEKSIKQICRWVISKEKEYLLAKHDNLFELSNDLIGIVTFEGCFIKLNPSFSKTLGWSNKELLASPFTQFILKDDVKKTVRVMQNLMKGQSVINFTNRYKTKDGGIKWIEWTSTPDMVTKLIFTIGRDVTEFVKKEQLLMKSEAKFRNLFDNVEGILSISDLKGNFIDVNPAGLAAAGYTREEMKQTSLFDIVAPETYNEIKEYIAAVEKYGHASGEMNIIKKSGEKAIWYFMSTLDEDSEGNNRVLTNVIDITERNKLNEELTQAKEEAEEALKIKSQFIAHMSHELRTPLNGIIGFTELALATELDETQKQYLEIINQSGATLYSIINNILDFSKIESNKMKLEIDKVEVEEVISEAFNIVSFGMNKKGLEMLIDIDHNIPQYIWADAMRLKQIFVNLLGNALKFTDKGEIKLYASILEDYGNGRMCLRFGVSDTGIGIHKDKQDEIFNAFWQEDSSITKKFGGTGLGLSITNKLLALGSSKLLLESEQGKGSNFYFDYECKVENEEIGNNLEDIKKVLIVDDNENNRKILRRMLEIKNIEVEEADSGLKALLIMMDHPEFDVIIMDYHMPVMDGIETIRKIKGLSESSQTNEQPFIILYSSSDDNQLQIACDELEIESRLVKPIRMKQMYQMLSGLKNLVAGKIKIPEKEVISAPPSLDLKILVADDNEINMQLTKLFLRKLIPNAIVIEAVDGEEAVEKYIQDKPDIVFMDVQMPKMNGLEATRQIRASEAQIEVPIIALTSGSMPGEKERCIQAGMTDFLSKPLLMQTLSNMLIKWLGVTKTDISN
ncbi:PAS domain-containing sensor histidine kinase [Arenibacter sp. H213]|nr:PAS domain-containing sensor histidine kinase [Arenibacter sp. H213]